MNARPTINPLPPGLSRRTVLGVTVAGATGLLTACGGSSGSTQDAAGSGGDSSGGASTESGALVKTAEVPVGAGVIVKDQKIVVVQPTSDDFKAFTAVCTHQGCTVDIVKDGTIRCPCHGSTFSAKDGSVTGGPAPRALASVAVKVEGGEVVKA